MSKIRRALLLALVITLLATTPLLAYLYRASVAITENASVAYDMLPVLWDSSNVWMEDNGFFGTGANTTRVQTLGGLNRPHLVADNKTLTAIAVPADSQTNLYFVTDESEQAMDIIVGYGGYVTVSDADPLEPRDNFEIELAAWVDTTDIGGNITQKDDSLQLFVSAANTISANLTGSDAEQPAQSTDDVLLYWTGAAWVYSDVLATVSAGYNDATHLRYGSGIRFPALDVPQGATITSATITFRARANLAGVVVRTRFTGHDVDDSATFANQADYVARRGTIVGGATDNFITTAQVDWDSIAAWTIPNDYVSPDLSAIVQEITDRVGWASGNDMTIFWDDHDDRSTHAANCYRDAVNFDGVPATSPILTVTYELGTSVAGMTSGVRTITVSADTTDFVLDVDGTSDTVSLNGASAEVNANDWILMSNTVPYMDYYNYTVNSTLVAWYQPNEMVLTTVLPDRQGGDQNGAITWGANPAGVGATLGSMTSSGQPDIGVASDTSTGDILPVVGGTDWNPAPDVSGALLANPMRPIVTVVSDNTTLSERQVWVWFGITFVSFITVLVGANVRGHHLITGIAASAAIVLMVVWTVFPLLSLLVVVLVVLGGAVSERSPSI